MLIWERNRENVEKGSDLTKFEILDAQCDEESSGLLNFTINNVIVHICV